MNEGKRVDAVLYGCLAASLLLPALGLALSVWVFKWPWYCCVIAAVVSGVFGAPIVASLIHLTVKYVLTSGAQRDEERERDRRKAAEETARLSETRRKNRGIQPGQYFKASGSGSPYGLHTWDNIYGECLRRVEGGRAIEARCYSRLCPYGEFGLFDYDNIGEIITKEAFMKGLDDVRGKTV